MTAHALHRAFGLTLAGPLDELHAVDGAGADVVVEPTALHAVEAAFGGPADPPAIAPTLLDARPYAVERGAAGDHRFAYADELRAWLSPGADTLRVWSSGAPRARRVLLDSVLATTALVRGFEALHAAAVAGPRGAVALAGAQGAGKTSLALALRRAGRPLVADDVCVVEPRDEAVLAHPGPPVANVPRGAPAAGRTLATIGDEDWIAVDDAVREALPLAAVVVLERGPGPIALSPARDAPSLLLSHALVSRRTPGRMARRFAVLMDVAARVPVLRLTGDGPPDALADAVGAVVN